MNFLIIFPSTHKDYDTFNFFFLMSLFSSCDKMTY